MDIELTEEEQLKARLYKELEEGFIGEPKIEEENKDEKV